MPHSRISVFPRDRATVIRGPQGPGGIIPPVLEQALLEAARRRKADEEINRKWTSLGGAPGNPTGDLSAIGDGFYRAYVHGRIYYRPGVTPFYVYGAIGDRYTQLGGPSSWLGWPTSDEQPFDEGGRISKFQFGAIYWWPDTEAIPLGDVVVRYTGLACFGETDHDQFSSADEPYVIFGVVPVVPMPPSAPRTVIYEDVDAGDSRIDNIELYRGLPYGLSLTAALYEHDFSDPEKMRRELQEVIDVAIKSGEELAKQGGAGSGEVGFWAAIGKWIAGRILELMDLEDDFVGQVTFPVTAKNMVTMAYSPAKDFRAIQWDMDSPLITGDGASYKVYIDIQPV